MKLHSHILLCLLFWGHLQAQLGNSGHVVYRSRNPINDPAFPLQAMHTIDLNNLYSHLPYNNPLYDELMAGGINADIGSSGRVTLSVYLYDSTQPEGKGTFLYQCYTTDQNSNYVRRAHGISRQVPNPLNPRQTITISSLEIKKNLQNKGWVLDCDASAAVNRPNAPSVNWGAVALATAAAVEAAEVGCAGGAVAGAVLGSVPACAIGAAVAATWAFSEYLLYKSTTDLPPLTASQKVCYLKKSSLQPVVVELEIDNARVSEIKVPMMESINLTNKASNYEYKDFFVEPVTHASVDVVINDDITTKKTINLTGNITPAVLATKLGDKITFTITSDSPNPPVFDGLPRTERFNFAGEVLYYCSPSVNPDELKPFLGFDKTFIRRYPSGWSPREEDFSTTKNSDGTYTFTWDYWISREMDASAPKKYSPIVYKWPVSYSLNGVFARYNQLEGYNMDLLCQSSHAQSFLLDRIPNINPQYLSFSKAPQYSFRLNPNEILYINNQYADTKKHGFSINGGLFQTTNPTIPFSNTKFTGLLPWQQVPENTSVTSVLQLMVDAYRLSHGDFNGNYNGYEIQDKGMLANQGGTVSYPEGSGIGNAKAPGGVSIVLPGNKTLKFKINATAPFPKGKYKGFYSQIIGTKYPALGEQNVSYTLSGLNGLPDSEIDKYYLQYDQENGHGVSQSIPARSSSYGGSHGEDTNRNYSNNSLSSTFTIGGGDSREGDGTYSITAYYKSCPSCTPVIIAGKELLPTALSVVNIKLKNAPYAINDDPVDAYQGESDKIREYSFKVGDEVTIALNDKYRTFQPAGTAEKKYFFSKRRQSNTIPSNEIAEGLKVYLTKFDDEKGASIANQPTFGYVFGDPGDYVLESRYRNMSPVYYSIHVVPATGYGTTEEGKPLYANVESTVQFPKYQGLTWPSNVTIGEFANLTKDIATAMPEDWQDDNNYGSRYIQAQVGRFSSDYMYGKGTETGSQGESAFPRNYTDIKHKNKFAPYNDLGYKIKWYLNENGVEVPRQNDEYVQRFLDNYFTSTSALAYKSWYPQIWLRLYSDDGGTGDPLRYFPQDMKTNIDGSLAYSLTQEKVEALLDGYFSTPNFTNDFEPWHKRLYRIAWTKSYGPRVSSDVGSIINLSQFFNWETGAFSGNPPYLPQDYLEKVSLKIMTDDQEKTKDFYYDYASGQKLILDARVNADGSPNIEYWGSSLSTLKIFLAERNGEEDGEGEEGEGNPPNPPPGPPGPPGEGEEEIAQEEDLKMGAPPEKVDDFLFGADLSSVNQLNDCGAQFKDYIKEGPPGDPMDVFDIFAKHGHNLVKVRLLVNPTWTRGFNPTDPNKMYSDIEDVIRTIRRAKKAGMQVLLAIEYSDAWQVDLWSSNPAHLFKDASSIEILESMIQKYTKEVLQRLLNESWSKSNSVIPDFIQIGTDLQNGMFHSNNYPNLSAWKRDGSSSILPSKGYTPPILNPSFPMGYAGSSNLGRMLDAALKGVEDFHRILKSKNTDRPIPIVLHLGDVRIPFIDETVSILTHNFDIIGISNNVNFTSIGRTISELPFDILSQKFSALRNKYKKHVLFLDACSAFTNQAFDLLDNKTQINSYRSSDYSLGDYVELATTIKLAGGLGLVSFEPAAVSLGNDGPFKTLWGRPDSPDNNAGSVMENCAFFYNRPYSYAPLIFTAHKGITWPERFMEVMTGEFLPTRKSEKIKSALSETPEKEQGMVVSPNPANTKFTLQFESPVSHVKMQLFNMLGIQVDYKEWDYKPSSFEVPINAVLPSGIYFVRATTDQGVFKTKIVIQK